MDNFEWFNNDEIPEKFKDLIPYIKKYGHGDDVLREQIFDSTSFEEKQKLVSIVSPCFDEINQLLDQYDDKHIMPPEIGCLMWLAEGVCEIQYDIE